MPIAKLQDLDLKDKKVLMRVDFNVPMQEGGLIVDDTKIQESLPSIHYILNHGGSVILMSHLGRPKKEFSQEFSLKPCAKALSDRLGISVFMAPDCIGKKTKEMAHNLQPGQVLLLENLRFHPAEENPSLDSTFAEQLSHLGDLYVNDAFGTAHREHSSTATIAKYFPNQKAAGLLLQKEMTFLHPLILNASHPFYVIIGGGKISTKLGLLKSFLPKIDAIFIAGAMAFTFFKAQGFSIGHSIYEEELVQEAAHFLTLCQEKRIRAFLPKDIVIADRFDPAANIRTIEVKEGIPDGWQGMDIGEKTTEEWKEALKNAASLFWNGPLGVTEFPVFSKGTEAIARFLSTLSATTIIGGGDSVAVIQKLGLKEKFSHLSTGGGAALEYLEFGHLPGIDALIC